MSRKECRSGRIFSKCVDPIEPLESRRLLDGTLPQGLLAVYSYAQTNFQSVLIDLTYSPAGPLTIDAGQTVTVEATSNQSINLYCSDADKTVSIDGNPTTGTASTSPATYDYANGYVQADPGITVPLTPGEHTVVFTLLDTDVTESVSTTLSQDGVNPQFSGPWVIANGNDAGSIFSSPLPFAINSTNHLAFTQPPTHTAANASITPPIQVAVEDAGNNILSDNDSVITLAPLLASGIDPTQISGTTTATMVNGIATFSGVLIPGSGTFSLYAASLGFTTPQTGGTGALTYSPAGMFVESGAFTIGVGGKGGGGGGSSSALTVGIVKSTLPASVVAGGTSHGSTIVSVLNSGGSLENSQATASVYASTDGSIDDTAILLGSVPIHRLNLEPGRAAKVTVPTRSLPASLLGDYTLLAKVTDVLGGGSTSSTGPVLTAAAPFIAFSETIIKTTLPPSDVSGQKTRAAVQLRVTNLGNIISRGSSTVALFASLDQSAGDGTPIRSLPESIVLKPGASRTIPLKLLAIPAVSNGAYYIVAQITDPVADITSVATPGTFSLAQPFIAFSFAGATTVIANHGKGPANGFFLLTNNGNIPSTGLSTVNLLISSDGVPTGSPIYSKPMSLIVQPTKTRRFRLSAPVADTAALAAAAQVMLQVIDPLGNVQMVVLPF